MPLTRQATTTPAGDQVRANNRAPATNEPTAADAQRTAGVAFTAFRESAPAHPNAERTHGGAAGAKWAGAKRSHWGRRSRRRAGAERSHRLSGQSRRPVGRACLNGRGVPWQVPVATAGASV